MGSLNQFDCFRDYRVSCCLFFGYLPVECLVVGGAMMFSSTIIGIKLLPTTILHHQHTGEVMISVLLLQDLIAIAVLFLLHGASREGKVLVDIGLVILGFPAILIFAYLFDQLVLFPLFSKFNRIREYLFLLAIGWCLSMAQLASLLGLSGEVGAFIAGVSLASRPVSVYISESLKPVRDFFLVLFFSLWGYFRFELFTSCYNPCINFAYFTDGGKTFNL
nr:cation:proton antiporter [Coxiella-like endosymbiont]